MLCKSGTQRQLVTDTSQLSVSCAGAGEATGKRGAWEDLGVMGVWEQAGRAAGGDGAGRELGKGMQRVQLLLQALWDAERISKALLSCCSSREKGETLIKKRGADPELVY